MNKNSAFTLIELLIGIMIMSIVFTIGYASYRDFSRRQELAGITKELNSNLRKIQQMASSGQKPNATCVQLNSYSFEITALQTYKLFANCTSDTKIIVNKIVLPTGITISGQNFEFKILGQGTNLSEDNVITISSTKSGSSSTVTVGKGGDIK